MASYATTDDVTVEQAESEAENHVVSAHQNLDNGADVRHRQSHGGELVPKTSMGLPLVIAVFSCALTSLLAGLAVIVIGAYMVNLFSTKSNISPFYLWWAGLLPFIMGWLGVYTAIKKNRTYLLHWGIWSLVTATFVTVVMFCVGNFYPVDYAVWKMRDSKSKPLCEQIPRVGDTSQSVCCCPPSDTHLSSVWIQDACNNDLRDTGFEDCDTVYVVSRLYIAVLASHGAYLLTAIAAIVLGYGGSVCATPETETFHQLEEDTVETVEGGSGTVSAEIYSSVAGKELRDMRGIETTTGEGYDQ